MQSKKSFHYIILICSPIAILLAIFLSVRSGSTNIQTGQIMSAITDYDSNNITDHIIWTSRLPRALSSLLVGALLAMSGAIMQGMTRNYLASPSILGVADGAGFVITLAFVFLPSMTSLKMLVLSFAGAALGAAIVFGIASLVENGLSPVKLAIIGTIIGNFFSSLSAIIASYFQVSQSMSFWYNARLNQVNNDVLLCSLPFVAVGIMLSLILSNSISILSLGKETSIGLGQRPFLVKVLALFSVMLMTGISVSLVGKIGFIGLIVPHITRFFVGNNYKWVIPCSGIIGGIFLTICDVISFYINYPFETPIGVVTSIIGVPFFLYLIKKKGAKGHE